jgi:hypothetical protein
MQTQLLLLELNEVNFEFVEFYAARGTLPNLARLIAEHGYVRTTSEERFDQLEPWIQWVTAHTGRSFAEHQVFRLGDIVRHDIPQIWELLESCGLIVGAVSPMNAKRRARSPAFFVPDPWTATEIIGNPTLRRLYAALSRAVNDNASAKVDFVSAVALLTGLARYAKPANYLQYLKFSIGSFRRSWRRAIFLDLLLADIFVAEVARSRPNFASLFLNAAAHIQHHYMFSAAAYSGPRRNPGWYIKPGADPILEVFGAYDRIIGKIARAFPQARLMLATGLHQVPHEEGTFYWRLKDHAKFLQLIGIDYLRVDPRMSRDFLVTCRDAEQARRDAELLHQVVHEDGMELFEIENRGVDLFVTLSYPREIRRDSHFKVRDRVLNLYEHVAFVAIKNGEHDGVGYFIDTGRGKGDNAEFPLKLMPQKIMEAFGVVVPIGGGQNGLRQSMVAPNGNGSRLVEFTGDSGL